MTHLIRLELKKIHLWKYILVSFVAICTSMFFVFVSLNDTSTHVRTFTDTFRTLEMIFAFLFVIYFAVMNAQIVIGEYNHRTILLMFTYPLKKKTLIGAKLLLITLFMAASMLAGNALCGLFLYVISRHTDLIGETFTSVVLQYFIRSALLATVTFCCLGLLTFAVGMVKKSVAATIVSSMVLIFLRQVVITADGSGEETLPVVLAAICITALALWYTFSRQLTQLD